MNERTSPAAVTRVSASGTLAGDDVVVIEEPLEIRLHQSTGDKPVSVTMRTPGDDFDLAAGFLFTEGIVREAGAMRDLAATDPVLARRAVVASLAKNKLAAVKEVRARRGLPPLSVTP